MNQLKDRKSSYQVRQILAGFCNLIALILSQKCVKGFRVTKIVKEIEFKGVCGELEAKTLFPGTIIHRIFGTNSTFRVK